MNLFVLFSSGLKKGKARVFYNLTPDYEAVAVVGLGKKGQGYNELEEIYENKESVRIAAAGKCCLFYVYYTFFY